MEWDLAENEVEEECGGWRTSKPREVIPGALRKPSAGSDLFPPPNPWSRWQDSDFPPWSWHTAVQFSIESLVWFVPAHAHYPPTTNILVWSLKVTRWFGSTVIPDEYPFGSTPPLQPKGSHAHPAHSTGKAPTYFFASCGRWKQTLPSLITSVLLSRAVFMTSLLFYTVPLMSCLCPASPVISAWRRKLKMEKTPLPSTHCFVGNQIQGVWISLRGKTFTLLSWYLTLPVSCLMLLHPSKPKLTSQSPAAAPGLCCPHMRTARNEGKVIFWGDSIIGRQKKGTSVPDVCLTGSQGCWMSRNQ